jgi:hypothetical protein
VLFRSELCLAKIVYPLGGRIDVIAVELVTAFAVTSRTTLRKILAVDRAFVKIGVVIATSSW